MSIDAIVSDVLMFEKGGGALQLYGQGREQSCLYFDRAFKGVRELCGCHIWGNSLQILMGEKVIAKREGYTKIDWCIESLEGVEMRYAHSHIASVV